MVEALNPLVAGEIPVAGLFGRDKVCAVVAAPDARGMMRQLRQALRFTRTVELRLDWLKSDLERMQFLGNIKLTRPRATMIATCRRRLAGGRFVKHPARAAEW